MENVTLSQRIIEEFESRIESKFDIKFEEIKSLLLKNLSNNNQQDDILSFKEGCVFLNIAEPTGYAKISKREIPFMKRGKFIYFSRKMLQEYLHSGRRKTVEELEVETKKSHKGSRTKSKTFNKTA